MEKLLAYFTWDKIFGIGTFIARPLIILLVCKLVIKALLKLSGKVMKKTKLDDGIQGFAKSALKIALWAISIIIIADSLGVDTASLVAILSVASLALSLAFQNIMTNVFSGLTILISRPFVVGDFVEAAGVTGTVKAIGLMRTTLMTPDNKEELVPNGDIAAQKITNYFKEPLRRVDLKVSASYNSPTETVKEAIFDVINYDNRIMQDDDHKPFVRLSAYNPHDIEYTIRVWTENKDYWNVYFDVMEALRGSFESYGVEFSYPHTVVHIDK